jgi:acetyltransferase-like isoleucine patch superfamily enzyme
MDAELHMIESATSLTFRNVLRALVPTGLRRLRRLSALRREHRLADLGSDFPYLFSEDTSFGEHCRVSGRVRVYGTSVGDWSYLEHDCHVAMTDIGRFTSIGPFTVIGLAEHPTDEWVSTHPLFYVHRPRVGYDLVDTTRREEFARTKVGNDVWIGAGARIKGGVAIGDGAVIGAGAVVTRDVPPFAIVVGVPAQVLRYRFTPDEIDYLLALRWWDRDLTWLRDNVEEFRSVDALRRRLGRAPMEGSGDFSEHGEHGTFTGGQLDDLPRSAD